MKENDLRCELLSTGLKNPRYAIVMPLVCDEEDPALLIEVRAQGIFQAGDPCFPGGKVEPGEKPDEAAAREMEEELGIHVAAKDFLGQLPTIETPLGSASNVYVCVITKEQAESAVLNPSEVETLLCVPLSFFLKDPHAYSYQVDGHTIWGMTAGAIRHLCAAWKAAESRKPGKNGE